MIYVLLKQSQLQSAQLVIGSEEQHAVLCLFDDLVEALEPRELARLRLCLAEPSYCVSSCFCRKVFCFHFYPFYLKKNVFLKHIIRLQTCCFGLLAHLMNKPASTFLQHFFVIIVWHFVDPPIH